MEEFIEGKFFSGELFLDVEKKAYAKLGFQKMSMKEIFSAIFSRKSRLASNKAKVNDFSIQIYFYVYFGFKKRSFNFERF